MSRPRRSDHRRVPLAKSVALFLHAWARKPMQVGAILPSSRWLARAMAKAVDVQRPGLVIELGAGTGVVTHALLEAGVKPEHLLVIERDASLHRTLQKHFPSARVEKWDALHLQEQLRKHGVTRVNAVVSSLPLLSMPKVVQEAIVEQIFAVLDGKGPLIQFTYGPKSSVTRPQQQRYGVRGRRAALVLRNIPPATVWKYESI